VMDFGLARSLETAGLTRTGALMGTPSYMSPEQSRGEQAGARSDLFTLGIILYQMITATLPFAAETPMASLFKRAREKAIPPRELDPEIPQAINDIVMKCLETNPDRRYQSAGEFLRDLGHSGEISHPCIAGGPLNFQAGADFGPRYRIEAL